MRQQLSTPKSSKTLCLWAHNKGVDTRQKACYVAAIQRNFVNNVIILSHNKTRELLMTDSQPDDIDPATGLRRVYKASPEAMQHQSKVITTKYPWSTIAV